MNSTLQKPSLRIIILLVLVTLNAFSNTNATVPIRNIDASSDVFVPGPKIAGVTDAWSLFHNPAGLAFVEGTQLVGGYAYKLETDQNGLHQGQGGLALSILEGLTLSAGVQLALPQTQTSLDLGTLGANFGAAFGFEWFAFGARAVKQLQYQNAVADPLWFAFGVESFPFSWLSLGASVRQIYDAFLAKPEVRAGVAFRPWGDEYLTLSAESKFTPLSSGPGLDFSIHPELDVRLNLAGYAITSSVRFDNVENGIVAPTIFLGIDVDFDHFGIGAILTGQPLDLFNAGGRFRLSSEVPPSLRAQKNDTL